MTQPQQPRRAAVLAAAINSWATTTHDTTDPAARLELRQAPDWAYAGKTTLTTGQVTRILHLLRDDLIPARPNTPTQAAAAVDQILAEWRAEGRTVIRPADLLQQLPRIAQTTTWLAQHLVTLADDGYITETRRPGIYRL